MKIPAKNFEDLLVWRKAHELALAVYQFTRQFPSEEKFGLTSQFRRAAVSVAANIAEGFSKRGKTDKARFFNIGQGSLEEARYYCILARDLGYGDTRELSERCQEAGRLLGAYTSAVLASSS